MRRPTINRAEWVAFLIAGVLGLVVLVQPHVLTGVLGYNLGYDDGVYVGAAVQFLNGHLPYRDFVLVHPPGIVYLLSPFAFLGDLFGTGVTVALARIATVLAVCVNAALAARLMGRCGAVVATTAGVLVALWPMSIGVQRATGLEPFMMTFVLAATALTFGVEAEHRSRRRLVVAGILIGFACAIKIWAIIPAIAFGLVLLVRGPVKAAFAVGLTAIGTLLVACLPFLIASPSAFYHDVITAQFDRLGSSNFTPNTTSARLHLILGGGTKSAVYGNPTEAPIWLWVLALVVLAGIIWAFAARFRERTDVEWFVLIGAVLAYLGMLRSPLLYDHYAYFPAVFVLCLGAIGIGQCVRLVGSWVPPDARSTVIVVALVAAFVAGGTVMIHNVRYIHDYLGEVADVKADLQAEIPKGACVLTEYPSELLVADRFASDDPDCPTVVDPLGTYLAEDDGREPHLDAPFEAEFVSTWRAKMAKAQYVVMRVPGSHFMPWPQDQIDWFNENFSQVAQKQYDYDRPFVDSIFSLFVFRNRFKP